MYIFSSKFCLTVAKLRLQVDLCCIKKTVHVVSNSFFFLDVLGGVFA